MRSWEKIDSKRMITVGARKWARLKEQTSWKLLKEIDMERKQIKQERERWEQTIKNLESALARAHACAIDWMDRCDELKKEKGAEL